MRPRETASLLVLALFFAGIGLAAFKGRIFVLQHVPPLPVLAGPTPGSEISCAAMKGENPRFLLVLGQSNAANHGERLERDVVRRIFLIHQGKCYLATDPLPGGTGRGAAPWSRLPGLLAPGKVAIVLVALESTSIRQWSEPGFIQWILRRQIESALAQGIRFDLVLWQHGETDARDQTSVETYRRDFRRLLTRLRASGVEAPIMAALSTRCRQYDGRAIRQALLTESDNSRDVMPGPDTDRLEGGLRVDGCHFSAEGLDAAARLWAERLRAYFGNPAVLLAGTADSGNRN